VTIRLAGQGIMLDTVGDRLPGQAATVVGTTAAGAMAARHNGS
jgi:hypothetical protein